jgi:hypothetical protein
VTDLESVQHSLEATADELMAVVLEKLADAETPGFLAEFDPEEAELAGAFREDALSEEDAIESAVDLTDEG